MQFEIDSITETDGHKKDQMIEQIKLKYFNKYDHQIDTNPYGECVLKNEKIAQILYDKI